VENTTKRLRYEMTGNRLSYANRGICVQFVTFIRAVVQSQIHTSGAQVNLDSCLPSGHPACPAARALYWLLPKHRILGPSPREVCTLVAEANVSRRPAPKRPPFRSSCPVTCRVTHASVKRPQSCGSVNCYV
jgi:hypothetical protein